MERTINWVLFIGIFIIFPALFYVIYNELQGIGLFISLFLAFIATGLISAIFITPIVGIIVAILGFFDE
ncbi:hypothetical protein MY791_05445 [Haemophilus influenzae]|jgi:hypothetical protein|uniref:hypothetical protein n=1 Tax=Haemophilus haemolyticus TaxID=726 RepID=UPI001CC3DFE3|nr:hypothetical protein [Haemophilus haemolyticus]MCK8944608.1 hypothetical protein [Haemophilus influenzae]BCL67506.1 hypothetical protein Hhaem_12190 [Haemophilus haemolyticus]